MATAAGEDTVWIGFMDIVPVIGTVKEAVELVLAVYNGNKAVVKEKEKAIENIVKESLKKHVKKRPDKPAAAAFSGIENVIEIRKETIAEHVKKGSKRGTKPPTPAEQKERQKRVEAIQKDMLEKIRIINPNFSEALKEELTRSKRGEHVFNNDILKFHFKVLTEFIQSQKMYNHRGYDQQAMNTLGKHTLSQNTAEDIQTNMVVHFGEDEFYMNANGVVYGEYCRALRGALLDVLGHINPNDVTDEERQRVNFVTDNMNNLKIYVDELAKDKWINNIQTRHARYKKVRQEVANMYRTDRGLDWCIRVLVEVAPLFGPRQ
ncbi:hypothetical protein Q8A67_000159 [Cirrhinus molitorella]|uniref:Uncharacterized protein n=1 Tax=Cirrhinus molitorella TaxID=172907 RepID=A0AA88QJ78_9TELE|nr:hypothetical protein Q8A67_000159 [Cirrhinus molitorella]